MLSPLPPSVLSASPLGETPRAPLPISGPSAQLVATWPFHPHPVDGGAKIPAPGLPAFFSGDLPPIRSVADDLSGLFPSPNSNNASLGVGSAAMASACPPSTEPNHNYNPNALPAIGSVSSLRLYSPPHSLIPSENPAGNRLLNVKDALSYLEMVKVKFQDKPDVYNHFLDIMKDFRSQAIDTPGVIDRVSGLFNGHATLIQGFNTFLPQRYRIDCTIDQHGHNLITVTTPSRAVTLLGGPPRGIISSRAPPAPLCPYAPSPCFIGGISARNFVFGLPHTDAGPSTKVDPLIEFSRAVSYISKVGQHFASDPDSYKQFLEIFQTYQKGQRPIAEVYQQVNVLFSNQRDLLEGFQQFLPDNGVDGGGAGTGGVGSDGNDGLFGMMVQMTAKNSCGRINDTGGKWKEPSGSGGASSRAGGGGDEGKRKVGKEREPKRGREREQERLKKEPEKRREKGKAENAAAKKKKRGLEKEVERDGKAGNSKRSKVAHGDAEDLIYAGSPLHTQQYHSYPNQLSTSHLAPSHVQSQNLPTAPDEVSSGACPTTNRSPFELASSRMSVQEMFDCLLYHGCTNLTPQLDFTRECLIAVAGGAFGDVYRGKLRDGTAVAVKALRYHMLIQDTAPKALKRATRELYTWSKAKHKNVQELLGVIMFQGQLGMVSPWMDNGNLEEYIRENPDVDRHDLCSQVASGVAYLHGIDMVHGDLKTRNVLVDKDGTARLSDFDHSILSNCTLLFTETTNVGGGTLRWMAPELLLSSGDEDTAPITRSKQTDIYALGMTMLEIISGKVPYAEYKVDRAIIRALDRKQFPARPKEVSSDWVWSLLEACWYHDPKARPSASWVYDQLLSQSIF